MEIMPSESGEKKPEIRLTEKEAQLIRGWQGGARFGLDQALEASIFAQRSATDWALRRDRLHAADPGMPGLRNAQPIIDAKLALAKELAGHAIAYEVAQIAEVADEGRLYIDDLVEAFEQHPSLYPDC